MDEIQVFYNFIGKNNPENVKLAFQQFPQKLRQKINQYSLEEDREMRISSKLLLLKAVESLFPDSNTILEKLNYNQFSKPFLKNNPFEFSSAHSSGLVVLAAHPTIKIGIDVEQKKEIDISIYSDFLHPNEIDFLQKSETKSADFLKIWTKKEAAQKALGKGIYIDLKELDASKNEILVEDSTFVFQELKISDDFVVSLASEKILPAKIIEVLL